MNFGERLEKNVNYTYTQNGAVTNASTLDANLDLFATSRREHTVRSAVDYEELLNKALNENLELAVLNILYILDIRNGKGERDSFKLAFKNLIGKDLEMAKKVALAIGELGRYDYLLVGMKTPLENFVVNIIKETLNKDLETENCTLIAKWLPSLRTHKKNNKEAYRLAKLLSYTPKEYRSVLKQLRNKINIVETSLTNKKYDLEFQNIPSKANMKYRRLFLDQNKGYYENYKTFLDNVEKGKETMKANNLFMDEIIGAMLSTNYRSPSPTDEVKMLNLMWENQDGLKKELDENMLIVADTSGSMDGRPYNTAMGLAIYFAEVNKGIWHNKFITFSSNPKFHKFNDGLKLSEKLKTINCIIDSTNIDKVFKLILKTAVEAKVSQEELPKKVLIISDMHFDDGTTNEPNFNYWERKYKEEGYELPTIVFWNVAEETDIFPVNKYDENVALLSGYSKKILENVLECKILTPVQIMLESLEKYKKYI